MKKRLSRTKIIATLGPASSERDVILKMAENGVDIFRVNFSHSSKEDFLKYLNIVREINEITESEISILADLQGPKLRIGEVENNRIELVSGDTLEFVNEKCTGNRNRVYMSYNKFSSDVNPGETILIDDGKIKLEVTGTDRKSLVTAKVIYGGILSSKKGVNLPNTNVSLPSLTEEDISNAKFAIENGVDWIALSFVRKASDIIELRELIKKQNGEAGIIAKIEKPEALYEIDRIIELSDAVMVARGDLGVEMPFDEVPLLQKNIVKKCIERSRPVIIATQIMESMISNFMPTRAESNDVGNAVLDGADALMLSGETSIGKFPVETIDNMQKIIHYTEIHGRHFMRRYQPVEDTLFSVADSVCQNAANYATELDAKAIITFTHSGYTAVKISGHRPMADILAFTDNKRILMLSTILWGVKSFYLEKYDNFEDAMNEAASILKNKNILCSGDCVVFIGSIPLNEHGKTNVIKVSYI